jgi:hypothetical protein
VNAAAFHEARERAPVLWWMAWVLLAVSLPTLLAVGWDARQFNGVSVWVKPWKFMVSTAVHLGTLALFATWLPKGRHPGLLRGLGAVALAAALFEVGYITWRASRGEASHFNFSTPLSQTLYGLMGVGAVTLTACAGVLGVLLWRHRGSSVLRTGMALGLMLGFVLGTATGAWVSTGGGHWVGGTPSDAGGLPVVGWSRDGGDLRAAHFFGLHAMQVVPAAAWWLARVLPRASAMTALWAFAAAYTGLTALVFAQAVSGRAFL